jgi:hypothetical protein
MHILHVTDLHRGTGILDHVMRTKSRRSDAVRSMRPADAVGITAALMKSNLSNSVIMSTLKTSFNDDDRALIMATLRMYDGPVSGDHLWDSSQEQNRVHSGAAGYGTPTWQVKKAPSLSNWPTRDAFGPSEVSQRRYNPFGPAAA